MRDKRFWTNLWGSSITKKVFFKVIVEVLGFVFVLIAFGEDVFKTIFGRHRK